MNSSNAARTRFDFTRFLKSNSEIVFSIVSEPPSDRPQDSCVDLCNAYFSPSIAQQEGRVFLNLVSEEGVTLGDLEIEWAGKELVSELLSSS